MGVFHIRRSAVAIILLLLTGISVSGSGAAAQNCQAGTKNILLQCRNYINKPGPKTPPALMCCGVIQQANLPCVCRRITTGIEKTISMEKLVSVSRYCGKRLPRGSKCGSYTVP